MHQAIKLYEQDLALLDEEKEGHFGLGKSLLMYLEIQINQGIKKEEKKQHYFEVHEEKMQEQLETALQQFKRLRMPKYQVYQMVLKAKLLHHLERLDSAK